MKEEKPVKAMTTKEKRVMEAHRLRYMEDCSNEEIANRLGVATQTVNNYFSESDSDKFKRFYSDMERFELERKMQQDIRDGEQLANNLLARAIQHEDASPSTLARASKLALENRKRKVQLLQELGVIQKPKERKEVTENSGEVVFNEEVVESREELENDAEVDASVE